MKATQVTVNSCPCGHWKYLLCTPLWVVDTTSSLSPLANHAKFDSKQNQFSYLSVLTFLPLELSYLLSTHGLQVDLFLLVNSPVKKKTSQQTSHQQARSIPFSSFRFSAFRVHPDKFTGRTRG